jgi:hypothetical protein
MARPARPEPKVFLSAEVVEHGVEWYRAGYFAHAAGESLLGEKSTSYLEVPEAADRAAAVLGEVPIIVQLRDPVLRAISNWRFSSENGMDSRTLTRALEDNLVGSMGWDRDRTSVSPYAYLERGRYIAYLRPWMAVFPSTVHVRFLDDAMLRTGSVRDLYGVLGVDPDAAVPHPPQLRRSSGPTPTLTPDLLSRLRAYFRPADERLRDLLDRDLPWPVGSEPAPTSG